MTHAASLQQRLVEVWSWLPAFRAVAEVEHVQRAARALHVTASSLSRSIRLLEEHLGKKVFDRVGRNIRLNHRGQGLLLAVRDGMRRIDDGIAVVTDTVFDGELRIACEGDAPIAFARAAAEQLIRAYPAVSVSIERVEPGQAAFAERLLRGEIDAAIVGVAPEGARLAIERLGAMTYGVYCGHGHPLGAQKKVTLAAAAAYPFVGPARGGTSDQWPEEVERRVALRVPALEAAIAACARGGLLAVLPDVAACEPGASSWNVRRLPIDGIASRSLFAVRRLPTAGVDRAGAFVEELKAVVTRAHATKPRSKRSSSTSATRASRSAAQPITAPRGRQPKRASRPRRAGP